MLSKLPGVNSENKGIRIFSRIYYSFLFLLFVMLMSANKEELCMRDKLVYILEMLMFFMMFAAPVPIIHILKKRGCGFPEIFFGIFAALVIFSMASIYAEKLYTDDYRTHVYNDTLKTQTTK